MSDSALAAESLLDSDFALMLWGEEPVFQRVLRLTLRSLDGLPNLSAIPSLEGDALIQAGRVLHKYAGRSGAVGMNRLAAALRAADHAIRAHQDPAPPIATLEAVLADSRQAAETYLASKGLPFVVEVAPADVDRAAFVDLLNVLERAVTGDAGTSELDDAMESMFEIVGEEPAWPAHEAVNAGDMDALRAACEQLRAHYGF